MTDTSRSGGMDPATLALHADAGIEGAADVAPPIHVSTTFLRAPETGVSAYARGASVTTRRRLEAVLGALEGGEAVTFSSGMAAVAAAVRVIRPRRLLLPTEVYHGVRSWAEAEAAAGRLELGPTDEPGEGDLVWVETPSNPKCLVTDIVEAAHRAHQAGALLAVDGTFATPILQQPLALGADVVMHSTTKAISGHSDALGGVIVTRDGERAEAFRTYRNHEGSVPGSLEAWLTLRGVRTLAVRVERSSETAARIAQFIADRGLRVWYPFADTQPGRDAAIRQMRSGGPLLSFEMNDFRQAATVLDGLSLFVGATSLGGVESLAEHRRTVNPRAPEGLIRLSVGLEAADDLIDDLDRALRAAGS